MDQRVMHAMICAGTNAVVDNKSEVNYTTYQAINQSHGLVYFCFFVKDIHVFPFLYRIHNS